ncbi:MAG TPA: alpha/beta hydrolase [Mycobacteriales bacterium]|nr:alpha/beta hydrolase [Mycobacteriales bacterium]
MGPMRSAAEPVDDGPWTHREVSANGIRIHVAEAGAGPLIVLLHGFPEHWYAWRHQFEPLADAGFRVVAPDLRGCGGTDKPPRGYDAYTLAGDIAGLVRALGERQAIVAGTGWGGLLAWAIATLHPQTVQRLVVMGMPHPLRLRTAVFSRDQARSRRYGLLFQLPRIPEALLTRADAGFVARLMREWSGPGWTGTEDFEAAARMYRSAVQSPAAAHCALEQYRWMFRSQFRPDGWRFAYRMRRPVTAPTLQLHGGQDGCIEAAAAQGSGRYVAGRYEWRLVPGAGHFLPEEAPGVVGGELIRWAKEA